jgi:hypothetical protein
VKSQYFNSNLSGEIRKQIVPTFRQVPIFRHFATSQETRTGDRGVFVRKLTTIFRGLQSLIALALLFWSALTTQAQTLNPTSIAFGNWVVQTTSTTGVVTLSNTQTVPLTITNISLSGDFAETSTCPIAPKALAAGSSCKIGITFTSGVLGALKFSVET